MLSRGFRHYSSVCGKAQSKEAMMLFHSPSPGSCAPTVFTVTMAFVDTWCETEIVRRRLRLIFKQCHIPVMYLSWKVIELY